LWDSDVHKSIECKDGGGCLAGEIIAWDNHVVLLQMHGFDVTSPSQILYDPSAASNEEQEDLQLLDGAIVSAAEIVKEWNKRPIWGGSFVVVVGHISGVISISSSGFCSLSNFEYCFCCCEFFAPCCFLFPTVVVFSFSSGEIFSGTGTSTFLSSKTY
jgi:hypothetical protein